MTPSCGIRGQDIHLVFDTTNAARQLHRLGEGDERLRRAFTLPKRNHLRTFEAEASRRYRRYQPVFARHDGQMPIRRQQAEQGLSVLWHEGVEIDKRGDSLRHAVGDAADHHAAVGMTDQNDIGQILVLDDADHVLNMRLEADLTAKEMLALAYTGQRWRINFMPRLAQPWRQLPPDHGPSPATMHQHERRHSFLPYNAARFGKRLGLKIQHHLCGRWHLVGEFRLDRAPEVAVDPPITTKTIIAVSTPILSATRPRATRCRMGYAR